MLQKKYIGKSHNINRNVINVRLSRLDSAISACDLNRTITFKITWTTT